MQSVASVTEITAQSPEGFHHAIQTGIDRAQKTLKNVKSVWIKDQEVLLKDGENPIYRVGLKVTFVLED